MSRRGRITLVAPFLYPVVSGGRVPFAGGAEVQQALLAKGLVQRGFDVTVVTCDFGQDDGLVWEGVRLLKTYRVRDGLPVVRFFHPRLTSTLAALRRADADVVMFQGADLYAGIAYDAARAQGAAYLFLVAHDHDVLRTLPDLRNPRDRWWYVRALRGADVVVSQTEAQRGVLREQFGVDSTVVMNPVDLPPVITDPGAHDTVAWLATYKPGKRPAWFARFARENPSLRCVMVGVIPVPPLTDEEYRAAADVARECPNLEVNGTLPHERIGELFGRTAVFTHTSPAEGFPNTFLEAWSYGVPTVTCFDPDGIIERERLGAKRDTYEDWAAEVRRFMADPALRREAGARARRYAETTHGSGAIHDRMAEAFDRAIAKRRRRR
jgi:glycosyltransferase involved in cell wall biosynthesis